MIRQQNKTISDFFKIFEVKEKRTKPPHAEDAAAFWKGIWCTKVKHICRSRMENGLTKKKKIPSEKQNTVKITKDDVKRKLKSTPD